ncbi:polyphenol oxidase family protein [Arthrobacter pityocampae]|uniref:polyphenol oxidase family protein n=1 Tax=Arthrobacter pityocampae TaxID=547334 RepID=UPI001F4EEEBA|nr:polyphenol oxidase family protein [Arthrobacter pityocampae]
MDTAGLPARTSAFHWDAEVRPGLRVAFTAVGAGNLALHVGDDPDTVRGNRRRLESAMGVPEDALHFMSQTHSDRVAVVDRAPQGAPDADAMVSPDGSAPLAVLVADCVPIVLADAPVADGGTGATAVVHAGRAGVGNGIVGHTVRMIRSHGARDVAAWIGPSVCGSCYEVPEDMMQAMAEMLPQAASRTPRGTPALDLPAAVAVQLARVGVRVDSPAGHGTGCTVENPELYSHRRDPGAGRIAGLVWRA